MIATVVVAAAEYFAGLPGPLGVAAAVAAAIAASYITPSAPGEPTAR